MLSPPLFLWLIGIGVGGYASLRFHDFGLSDANRLNEKYTLRFGCLSFGIGLRLRTLCTLYNGWS